MSLMQLLSVGRSLCGFSDEPSRYKMTQGNLLPKFGSTKELGKTDANQRPVRSSGKKIEGAPRPGLRQAELEMTRPMGHATPDAPADPAAPRKTQVQAFPLGRWTT